MWAGTPYSPDEDVGRDKNTVAQYFCTAWEIHLQQIIWELLCKDIISQRDLKVIIHIDEQWWDNYS